MAIEGRGSGTNDVLGIKIQEAEKLLDRSLSLRCYNISTICPICIRCGKFPLHFYFVKNILNT